MPSSLPKELYNPKAFFIHAAWLRQGLPHCAYSLTAASRRSSGPCLSPSVAGHPLRPARDRRLGEPLPHQLPNPTWAHPMACGPKVPHFNLSILRGISYSFP